MAPVAKVTPWVGVTTACESGLLKVRMIFGCDSHQKLSHDDAGAPLQLASKVFEAMNIFRFCGDMLHLTSIMHLGEDALIGLGRSYRRLMKAVNIHCHVIDATHATGAMRSTSGLLNTFPRCCTRVRVQHA